jgi:hypothetical protein
MSPYAVLSILAFTSNMILAIFIFSRNPKRIENQLFAFILFFFALWSVGEIIMRTTNDAIIASYGSRIFLTGGFLSAPVYLVFTLFFPSKSRLSSNIYIIGLIVVLSTIVMSMNWFTDLLISSAGLHPWGYSPEYGPFYPVAALLHLSFTVAGLIIISRTYLKTEIIIVRNRAKFIIIGTMVPIIFGSPSNVIMPLLGISQVELASTFTIVMGAFIAIAIIKYKVMITPVAEEKKTSNVEFKLKGGAGYLIEEEKPEQSFQIFVDLVTHGAHGLCVTRSPPDEVRREYGLVKTPIIWLSRTVDDKMCIDPSMTADLSMTMTNYIEESENGVVLLDGIEYMIVHNNFMKVLKFLHDLNEAVAVHGAILLVPIDKRTLNDKEYALLTRDLKELSASAVYTTISALHWGKTEDELVTV